MENSPKNASLDLGDFYPCDLGLPLALDVGFCIQQEDNDFWRRTLVRSVFAFIEAYTELNRVVILEILARKPFDEIPVSTIGLLHDHGYSSDNTGTIKKQALKTLTLSRIALTLRLLAEMSGKDEQFIQNEIFGRNEWNLLAKSMKVRNKLTHPKRASDLIVTDSERENCIQTFKWLVILIGELYEKANVKWDETINFFYKEDENGLKLLINSNFSQ